MKLAIETPFARACLIKSNHAEVVINCVFHHWIRYFLSPTKVLSDNGGDFGDEQYREMNERQGVETTKTAEESPFNNSIVKLHNLVLAKTMAKTESNTNCDDKMALA